MLAVARAQPRTPRISFMLAAARAPPLCANGNRKNQLNQRLKHRDGTWYENALWSAGAEVRTCGSPRLNRSL